MYSWLNSLLVMDIFLKHMPVSKHAHGSNNLVFSLASVAYRSWDLKYTAYLI